MSRRNSSYWPNPELVPWGDVLCDLPGCARLAEGLYEGRPLCIGCADLVLERELAVQLVPRLRTILPELRAQ